MCARKTATVESLEHGLIICPESAEKDVAKIYKKLKGPEYLSFCHPGSVAECSNAPRNCLELISSPCLKFQALLNVVKPGEGRTTLPNAIKGFSVSCTFKSL